MTTTKSSLNPNRMPSLTPDQESIIEGDRMLMDTPESIQQDIESVYDRAHLLNKTSTAIERLERAVDYTDMDDGRWTDKEAGIDGGYALLTLAERVHNDPDYEPKDHEKVFLSYMDTVIGKHEARGSIDLEKLDEKYPTETSVSKQLDTKLKDLQNLHNKQQEKLNSSDADEAAKARKEYRGDPRKIPGTLKNIERTRAQLAHDADPTAPAINIGNLLLREGDEVLTNPGNKAQEEIYNRLRNVALDKMNINRSEADAYTIIATELPNPEYVSEEVKERIESSERLRRREEAKKAKEAKKDDTDTKTKDDKKDTDAKKAGATPPPPPRGGDKTGRDADDDDDGKKKKGKKAAKAAADKDSKAKAGEKSDTKAEKKEEKKLSPELLRERERLTSIMDELATVQARAGFSPIKRGALKREAAELEAAFNAQIKRTSQYEMIELGLVDPRNPDPEQILRFAEDRTAKAYLELAKQTKEKPGSKTMEFFGKHGSKIVLGATALGMVLGGGFGGGITGAAASMALRTMAKRYEKGRGKQFDSLLNKAHVHENKKEFYTNNQLNQAARNAVKDVKDTRKEFMPSEDDSEAVKKEKYAKRQKYFNELFNNAFEGAGNEASKQFNRAVEKEYTSGYLGSIAVGAAVGTTMYFGGHMVGNALSYQFMGGPGSARWMLSTLDYNPAPGTPMSEIPGMVGYNPTYMSIQDAALSNFKPLEQWGWWRGL